MDVMTMLLACMLEGDLERLARVVLTEGNLDPNLELGREGVDIARRKGIKKQNVQGSKKRMRQVQVIQQV
ncbi:riboflavin biosynthesis protein [Sesbania bispinosa]|nr:riboflavin biosynthesis protein [Sesbania bispinosa]